MLGDGAAWNLELGDGKFQKSKLNPAQLIEFERLRELTSGLVVGATKIPVMAMRSDKKQIFTLLFKHFRALRSLFKLPELGMGSFATYIDGPKNIVTDPWLRSWLDALAFSLSGLPAARTPASALAYVLYDMHRDGATLGEQNDFFVFFKLHPFRKRW